MEWTPFGAVTCGAWPRHEPPRAQVPQKQVAVTAIHDDDGFRQLTGLKNLKVLTVTNSSVSFDAIEEMIEARPDIEIVE